MALEQLLTDKVDFNSVVSVQVETGESFTVPSGEVQAVTITIHESVSIRVNGTLITDTAADESATSFFTVLNGGDTISVFDGSGNLGIAIQGFEVSQ
jgi:hypothetical protein